MSIDLQRFVRWDASGCWTWIGSVDANGYGRVRGTSAHRAVFRQLVGPIPSDLCCDHLCRNRACVNPAHIELVTIRENILRGVGIAASNAKKTACKNGHPFNAANTWRRANGWRACRVCDREAKALRYEKATA